MVAYVALAALAVVTLTATVNVSGHKVPMSAITVLVLGMFALRTWLHHKREALDKNR